MSKVILAVLIVVVLVAGLLRYGRRPVASATSAATRPPIGSAESDAQTLRALRDAGADLTKPTEIRYYLYFPTQAVAERAAASARTPEFAAEVREGADGRSWLCLVTTQMVPREQAIRAATTRLQTLAQSLEGEYDGWEAAVGR